MFELIVLLAFCTYVVVSKEKSSLNPLDHWRAYRTRRAVERLRVRLRWFRKENGVPPEFEFEGKSGRGPGGIYLDIN